MFGQMTKEQHYEWLRAIAADCITEAELQDALGDIADTEQFLPLIKKALMSGDEVGLYEIVNGYVTNFYIECVLGGKASAYADYLEDGENANS